MAENFDYEKVKTKMEKLKNNYEEYLNTIKRIDNSVNSYLQVGDTSALYGVRGKELLDLWNDNCSIYENFYYVFDEWINKIVTVYNNNIELEATYKNIEVLDTNIVFDNSYQSRDNESLRKLKALLSGSSYIDGVKIEGNIVNGKEIININGIEYIIKRDSNGNIIEVIDTSTNISYKFDNRSIEDRIQDMYDTCMANGDEDKWNEYYNGLSLEEQTIADLIATGAFVANDGEVTSLVEVDEDIFRSNNYELTYEEGVTTKSSMLNDINNLRDEVYYEMQLLVGAEDNINNSMSNLLYCYEHGYITQEKFNELYARYEQRLEYIQEQVSQRSELYNQLLDGHHPWIGKGYTTLKEELLDAIKRNDQDKINECLGQYRELASQVDYNISDIFASGDISFVPLHERDSSSFGVYGENLSGLYEIETSSISNTTLEAAYYYSVASPGVDKVVNDNYTAEFYSTADYYCIDPYSSYSDTNFEHMTYSEAGIANHLMENNISPNGYPCDSVRVTTSDGQVHYFTIDEYNSWRDGQDGN